MRTERKVIFVFGLLMSLMCFAVAAFAQNQDVNPYMGMWYADHSNYRMYGADVLTRTTRAAAEARLNVIKGDHCYDTLAQEILLYNGSAWVSLAESGGGTLDQSYDFGGAGNGREITADAGAVKISGEDGLLVTGTFGSGEDSEWSGAGTGMFFNPKKAAFRAGNTVGTEWDNSNIGDYSAAFGRVNTSSGEASFSGGDGVTASGYASFSFGSGGTESSGDYSFATGEGATASEESAIAMGSSATASGFQSISIGTSSSANGNQSVSIGSGTTAKSFAETVIGTWDTDYTPTSTSTWSATDRLFVVGNGQNSGSRSDALVMLKNGNTGFGTSTPDTTLHVVGQIKYVDGNEANGYILQSDANGVATWKGLSYGQLYIYNGVTAVTITTAGTFYALTGATVGDTSLITTAGNNFTIVQDGVYKLDVCGSGTGTPNANATMAVFVDGVRSQAINGATKLSLFGDLESMSMCGILTLTAGDVVDVRITSDGNGDTMTPVYLGFSITQIR